MRCYALFLTSLFLTSWLAHAQQRILVEADYAYAGSHVLNVGPGFLIENSAKQRAFFTTLTGGVWWHQNEQARPTSALSVHYGYVPGLMLGLSSQQYYGVKGYNQVNGTDVRLSIEIALLLWGYIGYRYQYPLNVDAEAMHITRHSLIIRFPLPVYTRKK